MAELAGCCRIESREWWGVTERPVFTAPRALFAHPTTPGLMYVSDTAQIFLVDTTTAINRDGRIGLNTRNSVIAGMSVAGYMDGAANASQFKLPLGLSMNATETELIVCDHSNHRLRAIDLTEQTVRTVCGNGEAAHTDGIGTAASIVPQYIVRHTINSDLFYVSGHAFIRCWNYQTGAITTLKLKPFALSDGDGNEMCEPGAMVCTRGGMLIVMDGVRTGIFAVNPATGDVARIAGERDRRGGRDGHAREVASVNTPAAAVLDRDEQYLFFVDFIHIRRLTMPDHLFPM